MWYYNNAANIQLNNVSILNNSIGIDLKSTATGFTYYGALKLQENNSDWEGDTGYIVAGNNVDYNYLGWTGGYIEDSGCFRCGDTTNPINLGSGSLINTGIYRSCNMRENDTNWKPDTGEDILYTYGVNVPKQIQPVEYSGTEIILSSLGYSGDLYIGEINKIGENTDTTCNNCDGQYSVEWDNSNFIDSGFWSQNPNSCDILAALYGTGKNMENSTIYTSIWTGVQYTPICNPENMQVIEVSPGIDVLPEYLPNNTVYILSGGDYILSGNSTINLHNCNTIITKNGTGNFYSTGKIAQMFYSYYKNNIVLENLSVNGTGDGFGGSHLTNGYGINISDGVNSNFTKLFFVNNNIGFGLRGVNYFVQNMSSLNCNNYGFYFYVVNHSFLENLTSIGCNGIYFNASSYNDISNLFASGKVGSTYGVYLYNSDYNQIENVETTNSSYGVYIGGSDYNRFIDILSYKNTYGIYSNGNNNDFQNIESFGNGGAGLEIAGSYNILYNFKIYNNSSVGLKLSSTDGDFDFGQIYSNNSDGLYMLYGSKNTLNNLQIYNNRGDGLENFGSTYNSINNTQIYNNFYDGLKIVNGLRPVVNNLLVYNNNGIGIAIQNSNALLNNIFSINNKIGINLNTATSYGNYYGQSYLLENGEDIGGYVDNLQVGTDSLMGWLDGDLLQYSGCFRCGDITNPNNGGSGSLINTGIYRSCNMRGNDENWKPVTGEDIGYTYGVNVPKQIQPVEYSGTEIVLSSLGYSGDLYIGEINKIGENNDTTCNNCDGQYSVEWDNDNFVDEAFWNQNPNSCDILAALYGTGKNMEDSTIYTNNWSTPINSSVCNTENMKVSFASSGQNTIPLFFPSHTVYVIESGNYILSYEVNLNSCTAIIAKEGTGELFTDQFVTQNLNAENKDNIILKNLVINGSNDGNGTTHDKNSNGIRLLGNNNSLYNIVSLQNNYYGLLVYGNNNTLENIITYSNRNGIHISSSKNSVFKNIISNNNGDNGLTLYGGDNNYLQNILLYDNYNYGLYLYSSNSNLLSNIESFNNNDGVYIYNNSDKNLLINSKTYNNKKSGISIVYNNTYIPEYNVFANIQSFNNNNGIYLSNYISGNIFQNIFIYNNLGYGIYFYNNNIKNNYFDNISIYNNNNGIYIPSNVVGNYIYNKLNIFNNTTSDIIGSGENLIFGSGDTYSYLGRTTGEIDTGGTMSRDILINPKNELGNYLLSWTGTWDSMIGRNTLFTGISTQVSYGSNIPRQTQPVIWSGNELILSGEYDINKYIGGDAVALTGTLSGWNSTWHSSLLNLSYIANSGLGYNLFGDVYISNSGEVNTPISLILSQGTGTKSIIAQLFDGNSFNHFIFTSDYVDLPYVDLLDVQNQQIIENELINGGYIEATGSIKGIQEGYFIGEKDIRLYHSNGELLVPIIIQSTGEQLVEVQLLSGTIINTEDNQPYTGIVSTPIPKNPLESGLSGAIAAISVGSDISLQLKDSENNPIAAIIRIPVIAEIGENMDVYYSEDNGNTWEFHTLTNIVSLNGLSYVEFTTTHFTDFAIVGVGELPPEPLTGSFVINNDESYTLTSVVLLSLDASGATHMKFSNDEIIWSDWFEYTGSYERILSEGYGDKTVYADIDFDADGTGDILTSDSILYSELPPGQQGGNITLEITGGITECVYGTSLYLGAQDGNLDPAGYTFSGYFSPANRYCADFKGFDGWAFYIHTSDLENDNSNIISGSNVLISHDGATVQGHPSCTGYDGTPSMFNNGTGLVLMEKSNVADNNKICQVDISNVKLQVNVPPYQAPGDYVGTLTITVPNGF